jgi:hypothetical protein
VLPTRGEHPLGFRLRWSLVRLASEAPDLGLRWRLWWYKFVCNLLEDCTRG